MLFSPQHSLPVKQTNMVHPFWLGEITDLYLCLVGDGAKTRSTDAQWTSALGNGYGAQETTNLDYNTAEHPWNSHWDGRKPTALFTFHLQVWWLTANVAWSTRQSACVETESVSHWVELLYIQFDCHSHDGAYLHTDRNNAALSGKFGGDERKIKSKTPSDNSRHENILFIFKK